MDPISLLIGVVGLGLGIYSSYSQSKNMRSQYDSAMSMLNQQGATSVTQNMPEMPTAPTQDNNAEQQNAEAAAAREETLRKAAAQNAMVNPTGGMGLTNAANTYKKTLGTT